MEEIPFNRPFLTGNELKYIQQSVEGHRYSGDGPFSIKCAKLLEEWLGVRKALLTTSCTDALEMAAILLDIQPGDEVILPSFTFVSTANAFALHRSKPVFADIREDTLNIDETQLEHLITPHTKAIVPVHYGGVGCEMDAILKIGEKHNISVVEDNAHGLFGKYKGKMLGTFGRMATQSFHETKNIICGEGGALLINDDILMERAEIIREKGTNRRKFVRGEVDKYTWVDIGSSFLPSDILAAFLYAQLEARDDIQERRRRIWNYYFDNLCDWAKSSGVKLPVVPPYCEQSYHMFYVIMPNLDSRQQLIEFLKKRNIASVFHYMPLHLSEMGKRYGGKSGACPVTENVSNRLVRLPFFNSMSPEEMERVVDAVREFRV